MTFDSRSADTFGQVDLVVDNASIQRMAPLAPWQKDLLVPAMLAFAAGLLVATLAARAADEPARPRPTAEQGGTDSVRVQPTAGSSRLRVSPTSASVTRATSTGSIACSSVRRRRPGRRACAGYRGVGREPQGSDFRIAQSAVRGPRCHPHGIRPVTDLPACSARIP